MLSEVDGILSFLWFLLVLGVYLTVALTLGSIALSLALALIVAVVYGIGYVFCLLWLLVSGKRSRQEHPDVTGAAGFNEIQEDGEE